MKLFLIFVNFFSRFEDWLSSTYWKDGLRHPFSKYSYEEQVSQRLPRRFMLHYFHQLWNVDLTSHLHVQSFDQVHLAYTNEVIICLVDRFHIFFVYFIVWTRNVGFMLRFWTWTFFIVKSFCRRFTANTVMNPSHSILPYY